MTYKPTEIENIVMQVLGDSNKEGLGMIGQAMRKFIDDQKARQKSNFTEEELQLIEHMRVLKEAEDQRNLVWLDYKSWNTVNVVFRETFTQLLKPLFWNGVFTRLTDFYECESKVMSKLDHQVVATLFRKGGNYQIFCVGADQKEYQIMNRGEFAQIASNINQNLVRSYARADGRLYIKEFKTHGGGKNEQGANINSKDNPTSTTI